VNVGFALGLRSGLQVSWNSDNACIKRAVTVWELVMKDVACPLMFELPRSWLESRRQFDGRMEEPEL
jgi:hypothetical protein